MKKIVIILVAVLLPSLLIAKLDIEQGARYLKLGMTYLQLNELDKAETYINQGFDYVSNHNEINNYWAAVGYEYRGYLAQKRGDDLEAKNNFKSAVKLYKTVITQKDGSPVAVKDLENTIAALETNISPEDNYNNEFETYVSGNNIVNYDRSKYDEVFNKVPKNVENLSMSESKVKDLYPFYELKKLKYLNLSNNSIKTIPPGLSKLSNLKYLSLNNNKLKKIDANEFAGLKNLKVLDLRNNKLTSDVVFQLVRLLPKTNILIDKYEKVETEDTEEITQ